MFDRRGTGLSDRVREVPTSRREWTTSAPSSRPRHRRGSLLDGAGREPSRAPVAATYPERTTALTLYQPAARGVWAKDALTKPKRTGAGSCARRGLAGASEPISSSGSIGIAPQWPTIRRLRTGSSATCGGAPARAQRQRSCAWRSTGTSATCWRRFGRPRSSRTESQERGEGALDRPQHPRCARSSRWTDYRGRLQLGEAAAANNVLVDETRRFLERMAARCRA